VFEKAAATKVAQKVDEQVVDKETEEEQQNKDIEMRNDDSQPMDTDI
jgi:hypothetical protein